MGISKVPIKYLVLPLLVAIVVFVGYLMTYLGAFRPVVIAEKRAGPWTLLYRDHLGPYHKIVPVIEEVEMWAREQGLDCRLSFGLYLDDPQTVEESRLRSRGGCLLNQAPASIPENFGVQNLPEKNYVTATFEGSPGIGPMKVYPRAFEYFSERGLRREEWTLEVYEIHSEQSMTTTYYFPVGP